MAHYQYTNNGQILWSLTRAEDYVVTAYIIFLMRRISNLDEQWLHNRAKYVEEGRLFHDQFLAMLNRHLGRHHFPPLVFVDGYNDSYSVLSSWDKARERKKISEQLQDYSDEQLLQIIAYKMHEASSRPPRDLIRDAENADRDRTAALQNEVSETADTSLLTLANAAEEGGGVLMFVSFVQVRQGAQRFMALPTEAEAREDLEEFLTEWDFDGDTLEERIAAATDEGYVIGIGPSHEWVDLNR